jgi:hypothetical protein
MNGKHRLKAMALAHATSASILRTEELKHRGVVEDGLEEVYKVSTYLQGCGEQYVESYEKQKKRAESRIARARQGWEAACYVRKVDNRRGARSVHLARAFMVGQKFADVERVSYTRPELDQVLWIVLKYGHGVDDPTTAKYGNLVADLAQQFEDWAAGTTFKPDRGPRQKRRRPVNTGKYLSTQIENLGYSHEESDA